MTRTRTTWADIKRREQEAKEMRAAEDAHWEAMRAAQERVRQNFYQHLPGHFVFDFDSRGYVTVDATDGTVKSWVDQGGNIYTDHTGQGRHATPFPVLFATDYFQALWQTGDAGQAGSWMPGEQ